MRWTLRLSCSDIVPAPSVRSVASRLTRPATGAAETELFDHRTATRYALGLAAGSVGETGRASTNDTIELHFTLLREIEPKYASPTDQVAFSEMEERVPRR